MERSREEIVFYRKRLGLRFKAVRCADGAQKIVVVGTDEQYRNAGSSSEQLMVLGLHSTSAGGSNTPGSSSMSKRSSTNRASKMFTTDIYDNSQLDWASSDSAEDERVVEKAPLDPSLASFSVDPFDGDQQVSVKILHISRSDGIATGAADVQLQLHDTEDTLCLLAQVEDNEPMEYRLDKSKCGDLFDFKDELFSQLSLAGQLGPSPPASLSLEYFVYAASSPSYKPLDCDSFPFFLTHGRRKVRISGSGDRTASNHFVGSSSGPLNGNGVSNCSCAWSSDDAWPAAGSTVYSCNGVRVTGLDSEFQMGLLKSQARPLRVQFLPPTEETTSLAQAERDADGQSPPSSSKSERRSSSVSSSSAGRVRYSTFVHKFNHPLAAKLRKRIEELLAEYIACDWDAARREGRGTPQCTIVSLYRHIEAEMTKLGLFDCNSPQGGGMPLNMESHWDDVRNHIEAMIFSRVYRATIAIGPPGQGSEVTYMEVEGEEFNLDGMHASSFNTRYKGSKRGSLSFTPLNMKLAHIRSITLKQLGLKDSEGSPGSAGVDNDSLRGREEWRLAMKALCQALQQESPGAVLQRFVTTLRMIAHALDAFMTSPSGCTTVVPCGVCGKEPSLEEAYKRALLNSSSSSRESLQDEDRVVSLRRIVNEPLAGNNLSADELLPALTWVVIQANPPLIERVLWMCIEFRHPDMLHGEEAYCLSQVESVLEFCRQATSQALDQTKWEYIARLKHYNNCLQLMCACRDGDVETVRSLASGGDVDVNALSPDQRDNALSACVRFGRNDLLRAVLAMRGIVVDARLSPCYGAVQGSTALGLAASLGNAVAVLLLLRAGADRYISNDDGDTPLLLAQRGGHERVYGLLCADPKRVSVWDCVRSSDSSRLECLLLQSREGVDKLADGGASFPLLEAVERGHLDTLRCLLRLGRADVNLQSRSGQTALMLCARKCCGSEAAGGEGGALNFLTIMAALLRAGASKGALDVQGRAAIDLVTASGDASERAACLLRYDPSLHHMCLLAKERDLQGCRALVLQGADCNDSSASQADYTALIAAVFNEDYEVVDLLLRSEQTQRASLYAAGLLAFERDELEGLLEPMAQLPVAISITDVNRRGRLGMTALMYAAQGGNARIVGRLLKFGADRALINDRGHSSLDIALANGHIEAANTLKYEPAKVSICLAARHGDWAVVSSLLRQGVSVNFRTEGVGAPRGSQALDIYTPLIAAVAHGHADLVRRLLSIPKINVNAVTPLNQSALIFAACKGSEQMVLLLLQAGADRTIIDAAGNNAATWAAKHAFHDLAVLLLHDPQKVSIFDVIVNAPYAAVVAMFKQGVDPNAPSEARGETPLIVAAKYNKADTVALLLKAPGIRVNEADKKGWTALYHAAMGNNEEIILLLLKAGASRKTVDVSGVSVVDAAFSAGNFQAAALVETDPYVYHIHDLCETNNHIMAAALIKQGCPRRYRDERGGRFNRTPLHAACLRAGNKEMIRILLSHRDVLEGIDDQDDQGLTALMVAAKEGASELTSLLIGAHCNTSCRDKKGLSASDYARRVGVGFYMQLQLQMALS